MGFRSPLVLMSTVGLFTLGFLAPWGATKAVADPSGDRLGCGTACQSAGQYGAPGSNAPQAVTILSSGTVTPDPDGYVPVTLTCHMQTQCVGALLLELRGWDNPQHRLSFVTGRSDLQVNGGATRTIGVPVPAAAIAYVRSQGPTPLHVITHTDAGNDFQRLNDADLMLAAP
jgi:hypothetical protein